MTNWKGCKCVGNLARHLAAAIIETRLRSIFSFGARRFPEGTKGRRPAEQTLCVGPVRPGRVQCIENTFERSGTWRSPQGSAECGKAKAWLYKVLRQIGTEWNLAASAGEMEWKEAGKSLDCHFLKLYPVLLVCLKQVLIQPLGCGWLCRGRF